MFIYDENYVNLKCVLVLVVLFIAVYYSVLQSCITSNIVSLSSSKFLLTLILHHGRKLEPTRLDSGVSRWMKYCCSLHRQCANKRTTLIGSQECTRAQLCSEQLGGVPEGVAA